MKDKQNHIDYKLRAQLRNIENDKENAAKEAYFLRQKPTQNNDIEMVKRGWQQQHTRGKNQTASSGEGN